MIRWTKPLPLLPVSLEKGGIRPASDLIRDDENTFCILLPPTLIAIRGALAEVMGVLDPNSLGSEERGTIELVLAEVLNNIVLHAYGGDTTDGMISLKLTLARNGLQFTIRDDGGPMPPGELPLGRVADPNKGTMAQPEHGFGWFIIRAVARDIAYIRAGGQNTLTFRIVARPLSLDH